MPMQWSVECLEGLLQLSSTAEWRKYIELLVHSCCPVYISHVHVGCSKHARQTFAVETISHALTEALQLSR